MSVIKFGTDGWRGVIAKEFTFANIAIVTQAVASYIKAHGLDGKPVAIGFDNRFLGHLFAERAAEVLAGNGIAVRLCDAPAPTPAVASMIVTAGLAGALMVTASHNPPEYNGIKFIPQYAGPATPEITDEITRYVREVESGRIDVHVTPYARASRTGTITAVSPRESYGQLLKRAVDGDLIRKACLKVVLDPMHGAGIGYLEPILQELGVQVLAALRNTPDPMFGGGLPEPSAERLQELARLTREQGADLGLALDGDADRFGILDPSGAYVTPNEVFALLTHSRLARQGMMKKVARTVATTHLIDRIAAAHGVPVVETPVGFKYIGQEILSGAGIGGEESGGLSVAEHLPEKDGLLVALLMLELRARTGRSPKELLTELGALYGSFVNERLDVKTTPDQKELVLQVMQDWSDARLGLWDVTGKTATDGVKLTFASGAWVLVRPSGTEPLLRIYLEAQDARELAGLKRALLEALGLSL
ncbi:alpha-D-glucose phosphate-specific phosphoglucomutase [Tumebacillus sp. BK434]|uniref:phosphoglucomutase/phosphomannomutase family protein n=1 Tax=Tumebacillus sp. BK434 TaxID=2512169 RepID=UPI0010454D9B|nr:phosphoglucomutase/phosphomannomutase family protein [Tumebacillus sp. BK434]TCP53290.1 alpha-D-glucose phosphate-specific phosphoglucomutase [Tumebacillus sp. BK434]